MIVIKLREAMERYRQRTGIRLTYESLSEQTGISVDTLQSMATRKGYNTRLTMIEKLCLALKCSPGELLALASENEGNAHENQ